MERFVAVVFPLCSRDLIKGTSKYSEFMDCLQKVSLQRNGGRSVSGNFWFEYLAERETEFAKQILNATSYLGFNRAILLT